MRQASTTSDPGGRDAVEILGRSSSHYTRVALILARVLDVPYRLTSIADMRELDAVAYAGNPALKLPILRTGGELVFGTLNICRALATHGTANRAVRIIWPEDLQDHLSRNAQELVWHCMAAQVQLVMGTVICGLDAGNIFFVKARAGMEASLAWLDSHLDGIIAALPARRDVSLFETTLFCLVEHLSFRPTVSVAAYQALNDFATTFRTRDAARATAYRFS